MFEKDKFFSSLKRLAKEPVNNIIFVSTDKRDLPQLVDLIRSCINKKEFYANTQLKNLVNSEPAQIMFIIKLIVYGQTTGDYDIYYTKEEVDRLLTDAEKIINQNKPLSEKFSQKIQEKKKGPKGYQVSLN
jgi:hypothetical protein